MQVGALTARLDLNMQDFESNLNRARTQFQELGNRLEGMSQKLGSIGQKMSAGFSTPVIGGLIAVTQGTRELRQDLGKLDAAFTTNGFTAEQAKDVYHEFYGILGESDTAIEASNHLALLTNSQKELNDWVTISTGVYATFGDSLPIEGLTEAANETAKVGQVVGPLADALNWAGVSEDAFNESLAACTTEQERQALITETLNGLYTEAAEKYREVNGEVIEANKANVGLSDSLANLASTLEPIMTTVVRAITDVVNVFNNLSPSMQKTVITVVGLVAGLGPLLAIIPSVITGFSAVAGAIAGIPALFGAIGAAMAALSGPIGIVIGLAAGVVAAGIAIYKNWDTIREKATEIWNGIRSALSLAWNGIKGDCEKVWNAIKDFLLNWWSALSSAFTGAIDTIKNLIFESWNNIHNITTQVWTNIQNWLSNLWYKILAQVRENWANIRDFISNIADSISDIFQGLVDKAFNWGRNLLSNFIDGIRELWDDLRDTVSGVAGMVGDFLGFHSPTKEGPGRFADEWAPNFMKMFAKGIENNLPILQASLDKVALNLNPNMLGSTSTSTVNNNSYGSNTIVFNVTGGWEEIERELYRRGVRI